MFSYYHLTEDFDETKTINHSNQHIVDVGQMKATKLVAFAI